MACSLLSLAHVYGATELERNCLVVMKANMAQGEARRISPLTTARAQTRKCASHLVPRSRAVVTRADFHFAPAALGPLAPEAFVKFNLHCAGIEHVEPGRRRKRGEE